MSSTIVMFDQGTGAFSSVTGIEAGNNQGKLLLNILIELRVHSVYLASIAQDVSDDTQTLRADVINSGSI